MGMDMLGCGCDRRTGGLPEVHAPAVPDQNILALESGLEGQAQRHLALGGALEEQLGAGHQQRQLDGAGVLGAVPGGPFQQVGRILWWAADVRRPDLPRRVGPRRVTWCQPGADVSPAEWSGLT